MFWVIQLPFTSQFILYIKYKEDWRSLVGSHVPRKLGLGMTSAPVRLAFKKKKKKVLARLAVVSK